MTLCVSTYEIHSMLVACYGVSTWKWHCCQYIWNTQYARSMLWISTWRFYHVHFACYRYWFMIIEPDAYSMSQVLVHDDYIPNAQLHVTGVSTWWLYDLHSCMLRDWYNNIPNCDCEHGISYYSNYRSRLCFSDIHRFCMDLISSSFCWVICSLSFYLC